MKLSLSPCLSALVLAAMIASCAPEEGDVPLAMPAPAPASAPGAAQPDSRMRDAEAEFLRRYATCSATQLERFAGQLPTTENLEELTELSGAKAIRLLRAGEPMSMEGLTGRLNIELDADGRMRRFFCG